MTPAHYPLADPTAEAPLVAEVITGNLAPNLVGALLIGFGVMALVIGGLFWGDLPGWSAGLLAAGVALPVLGWWLLRRSSHLMRLALGPDVLRLAPYGRTLRQGVPARTVPLAEVVSYGLQDTSNGPSLKLTLTGGRVLRLSERPLGQPAPGTVKFSELLPELLAVLPATVLVRPSFYQTRWGTACAWLAWALGALGLLLTVLGQGDGWRLLIPVVLFLSQYYRNRRQQPA